MNLSQLRYAKAVAETGSFTQAAEHCHVTQPTLSNGIFHLEQELEGKLFTRTTRSVSLTPFGQHILPFIDNVLKAQKELLDQTRIFVNPLHKVIRIGASPLIKSSWLMPMLDNFRTEHEEFEIILHEQNMADLYRMLEGGLLDFSFGIIEAHKSSFEGTFLYSEPLYYIPRSTNYPEAEGSVYFENIASEIFVMVPDACGLAKATRSIFRSHRRKLNEYPGEALSYQVLEEWAVLGLGAAILPKSKLQSSTQRAYAMADKDGKQIYLSFEAVWRNDSHMFSHLEEFKNYLTKYIKQ